MVVTRPLLLDQFGEVVANLSSDLRVACFSIMTLGVASVSAEVAQTAKFLVSVLETQPICLRTSMKDATSSGAADAFAHSELGGLGGLWVPAGAKERPSNALWFSIPVDKSALPAWFWKNSGPLQKVIASLEALAQLVLVELRAREGSQGMSSWTLQLRQLCDNQAVASACAKWLASS